MPTSDPLEILLASNRWATQNIIDACENLPDEQFHQRFEMGPGSLHNTLNHILASMQYWADVLAERAPSVLESQQRTPEQMSRLLTQIADDLESSAHKHPNDGRVARTTSDRSYDLARGGVLTHVTTHGMHHRAQCLNMLRHVGVDPLPASSVHEWMNMVDATETSS
ncbi:MAG: hypothetical protein CMJ59_10930 [Planctomycetaceae bacterium]|nr:hypothetical protein [Planctomycetaceae bacterium]